MEWRDDEEQAAFRSEVARFIEANLPPLYRQEADDADAGAGSVMQWQADRKSDDAGRREAAEAWRLAVVERGWVAAAWPKEYGGAGLTAMEQFIFNEEMAKASAPMVTGPNAVWMLGPTLIVHGTDEQKQRILPDILSGRKVWAQGYSEPGAGSDLAALQTKADRDGDEYVINGQKIWTSGAHNADAIFVLARTDREAPKHRGISFLMVEDIHATGLTVRPLVNMAWGHEFNETFFENVRTSASNLVGEENRGWYVAMTLLDFERSGVAGSVNHQKQLQELIAEAKGEPRAVHAKTQAVRNAIADAATGAEVAHNFTLRIASMQARGLVPNYEASMAKVFAGEIALGNTRLHLFGLYSNLWDPEDPRTPMQGKAPRGVLHCTAGGGTAEIQRNVIATRGLGLPRG